MRWLRVAVLLTLAAVAAAEPPKGLRCYFGSTHAHCWFASGGDDGGFRLAVPREESRREPSRDAARRAFRRGNPGLYAGGTAADAYRYAHETGRLDFLAITIHDHMALPEEYEELRAAAADANRRYRGAFCALHGQEWSRISEGNHVNVIGADELCGVGAGRYDMLFGDWLPGRAERPVVTLNHPFRATGKLDAALLEKEYGLDDFGGDTAALARAANPHVRLIEVITGPAFGRQESPRRWRGRPDGLFRQLNRGLRVAPCAGTDNHYQNWGTSSPARTGVWAQGLAPRHVLDALRERRAFATEDRDLSLWLDVDGAPMGGARASAARRVRATLTLANADEPGARYQVRWIVDRDGIGGAEADVVLETRGAGGTSEALLDLPAASTYVLVHVVQIEDEDSAWSAPVWIDRPRGETGR